MKHQGSVELTCVNVISKFEYDQINISYTNALLKNMSNPSKFSGHEKNIAKLKDLVFTLNGAISL